MAQSDDQSPNPVAAALQQGLSSGVGLLLWGGILLYCPQYFHTSGWLTTTLYIVAVVLLVISVGVTFNEVGKALHSKTLSDLGATLAFCAIVGILWYFTALRPFPQPWELIAQLGTVLSAFLGAIFLATTLATVPSALIRPPTPSEEDPADRRERQTQRIRSLEALLAAALSFGAAAVGLVALLLHVASGK
jgi:hypothetical protein